jgi:hypothetical protein
VKNCEHCGGAFEAYRPLQKFCQPCRPIVKVAKRRAHYEANKESVLAQNKAWYGANKESALATTKAWHEANPEKGRKYGRKYREANLDKIKAKDAERDYGLPHWLFPTAREHLLCDICHQPETQIDKRTGQPRPFSIDHAHALGELRGTLCGHCNRGLGLFQDNPARLRAAADYLEAHNEHARYSAQIAIQLQIPTNI